MEIEERLNEENLVRLRQLARQLKIEGRSKLKKKQEFVDHIKANCSDQEINAALDVKVPMWIRIKNFTNSYGGIITTMALLLTIIFFVYQQSSPPPTQKKIAPKKVGDLNQDTDTYLQQSPPKTNIAPKNVAFLNKDTATYAVVFSEVLYDSWVYYESEGEWIELYNTSSSSIDISGWTIKDSSRIYVIPTGTTIDPQCYLIVADGRSAFTQQYGCNPHLSDLSLHLLNSGGYLTLRNSENTIIDQVAWESGGSYISGWGSTSQPYANEGRSIVRSDLNQDTDSYADWMSNRIPNPDCNARPQINLSSTQLNFVVNAGDTNSQDFSINNSGCGTLNWTVTDDKGWIMCKPINGTNSGVINVSINSSGLAPGTYTGTVCVNNSNASNLSQILSVTLKVYVSGSTSVPFGSFDTPITSSTVRGSIPVAGWVVDDIKVVNVKIYNGSNYIGDAALIEGARPDIEQSYLGSQKNFQAWGYMMLTNLLPNGGNGTYTLYAKASDVEGHQVTLGSKIINVDNAHAVKPFGAIDTPKQGGTASGNNFINWGWALTPQPNSIPTNGSTIDVWVDGVKIGHPTYHIYRSDIADLFPGYANSGGAVGYFYLDTTAYKNGVHIIHWTAKDNAGNSDGIGSRYFLTQNTGNSRSKAQTSSSSNVVTAQKFIHLSQIVDIPLNDSESIKIKRGLRDDIEPELVSSDELGVFIIKTEELERLVIEFLSSSVLIVGYTIVGNQLRPLPIGSSIDTQKGKFYWQPGPGFVGHYRFVFIERSEDNQIRKENIIVKIEPKFKK
jgi:hypothetical protein